MGKKSNSSESKIKWLIGLLVSVVLPAFLKAFLRYFVMLAFILFYLAKYAPFADYQMWFLFLLAVFGLWKFFDFLDEKLVIFIKRVERNFESQE